MEKKYNALESLMTQTDRNFYLDYLQNYLPEKIIDVHTHVWLEEHKCREKSAPQRTVQWPDRVARVTSIEELLQTYTLFFPGKTVTPVIFSNLLDRKDNFTGGNAYISACSEQNNCPCLLFSRPDWSGDDLEAQLIAGNFLGIKPYLSLADSAIPQDDITIFDFLTEKHLSLLNKKRMIVMLHIPRSGRLRDPMNIKQLLCIDEKYPDASVIIAHVGRAYAIEDIGTGLREISKTKNLLFDISANTNTDVFHRLIDAVGPQRILFGSDLPITRMRMRRIVENGRYINIIPRGMYGDVSSDPNMRETSGTDAAALTFFLYEEIDAFRRASETAGLTKKDISDIFYENARHIIEKAAGAQV